MMYRIRSSSAQDLPLGSSLGGVTPETPIRAAIYLRISLDPEMDGLAIERQREDCVKLAKREGSIGTAGARRGSAHPAARR